jgi:hypothetical protein
MALGRLPRVVEIVCTIYTFRSVMCGHDVFVVASAINSVDCRVAQPNVASRHDDTKVLDRRICCGGGRNRPASSQALWRFIAMVWDRDWRDRFNRERFGAFTIVKGRGPVTHCGEGLVVASHSIRDPIALSAERLIVALHDVRGQSPLWRGAHCYTQPSRRPRQGIRRRLFWREVCCGPPRRMRPPWRTRHTRPRHRTRRHRRTRTPSSAYSPYSTSACLHRWSSRGAVWSSSHPASDNI